MVFLPTCRLGTPRRAQNSPNFDSGLLDLMVLWMKPHGLGLHGRNTEGQPWDPVIPASLRTRTAPAVRSAACKRNSQNRQQSTVVAVLVSRVRGQVVQSTQAIFKH